MIGYVGFIASETNWSSETWSTIQREAKAKRRWCRAQYQSRWFIFSKSIIDQLNLKEVHSSSHTWSEVELWSLGERHFAYQLIVSVVCKLYMSRKWNWVKGIVPGVMIELKCMYVFLQVFFRCFWPLNDLCQSLASLNVPQSPCWFLEGDRQKLTMEM